MSRVCPVGWVHLRPETYARAVALVGAARDWSHARRLRGLAPAAYRRATDALASECAAYEHDLRALEPAGMEG